MAFDLLEGLLRLWFLLAYINMCICMKTCLRSDSERFWRVLLLALVVPFEVGNIMTASGCSCVRVAVCHDTVREPAFELFLFFVFGIFLCAHVHLFVPVGDCHAEGVEAVVVGEGVLFSAQAGHLVDERELLISLEDAVVAFDDATVDDEPVRHEDGF